jgi:hypothetical protein
MVLRNMKVTSLEPKHTTHCDAHPSEYETRSETLSRPGSTREGAPLTEPQGQLEGENFEPRALESVMGERCRPDTLPFGPNPRKSSPPRRGGSKPLTRSAQLAFRFRPMSRFMLPGPDLATCFLNLTFQLSCHWQGRAFWSPAGFRRWPGGPGLQVRFKFNKFRPRSGSHTVQRSGVPVGSAPSRTVRPHLET